MFWKWCHFSCSLFLFEITEFKTHNKVLPGVMICAATVPSLCQRTAAHFAHLPGSCGTSPPAGNFFFFFSPVFNWFLLTLSSSLTVGKPLRADWCGSPVTFVRLPRKLRGESRVPAPPPSKKKVFLPPFERLSEERGAVAEICRTFRTGCNAAVHYQSKFH